MKMILGIGVRTMLLAAMWLPGAGLQGAEFFKIESPKFHDKEPSRGPAVFFDRAATGARGQSIKIREFVPCVEARVLVEKNIRGENTIGKAYFYDARGGFLAVAENPSASGARTDRHLRDIPAIVEAGKQESLFFAVPETVRAASGWRAVVVFGDRMELCAAVYAKSNSAADRDWRRYAFAEKDRVGVKLEGAEVRKAEMDPVVVEVVRTRNETQPQITLLMRPPKGVSNGAEVRGVMAMCLLANSVDDIKEALLKGEHPLMRFADENKLAIVAWGSRRAWELAGSYHEFDRKQNRHVDAEFDKVAAAWERGIKSLVERYGIPRSDYLLWAASGAANWAHRLALRRPQYFAAVHVEILSTHDRPSPEARSLMWLVTTGEIEGGYESSLRFYKDCRELGYPMIYKAYPGVGHASCPAAQNLGRAFFQFALDRIARASGAEPAPGLDERRNLDEERLAPFVSPEFFGDIVNQEKYPADEVGMIPPGFRTPLPDKSLAEAWMR